MNKSKVNKSKKIFKGIVVAVVGTLIAVSGIFLVAWTMNTLYCNDHIVTVTVTDKGIKQTENGSKYLIYGTKANGEVETYEITDNIARLQVDSSNKYGSIRVGETYNFKVIGVRVPYLSWYENIIEINCISQNNLE